MAGKQRISKTNALTQLKEVWEITAQDSATESVAFPNTSISTGYKTLYSYDTLNNLTTVSQGVQTRTFVYDSLSRLKSATNPESGTINYVYDPNGNLSSKVDARGVKTDYVYDALNRVTNRNYSLTGATPPNYQATPDVSYTYDNLPNAKGKLVKVTNGTGVDRSTTEYTAFDILGRVTGHKQTTDVTAYTTGYVYNLSGALIEEIYPSGRVVKNVLDNNGDLETVKSTKNANFGFFDYAKNFTYNAAGAVTSMQLGNGRWESTTFNSRLQPTQIALGVTQGSTRLLDLDYTYGTTNNNGNLLSQTITVPTVGSNPGFTAVQNYTYDSLNRLSSADEKPLNWSQTNCDSDPTKCWKQTFVYDRYGNRTFDTTANRTTTIPAGCPVAVCNPSANPSDNKLKTGDGYVFDNSGNTTTDAENRTFIYDGENKQVEVRDSTITPPQNDPDGNLIGRYWYDGDGKRVKKIVPGTGETTIFAYDAAGKLVAEYSTIVEPAATAKVSYLTNDHLGSPRITTDAVGQVISRRDFHPFGEEILRTSYGSDSVRQKFTGYEHDGETNLDFAQARYFASALGRFNTPDEPLLDQYEDDPQSWNLYSYVRNNPAVYLDPSGQWRKVPCSNETVGGIVCVESDRDDDTYESLAAFMNIGNVKDLRNWFGNQQIVNGQTVFEMSDFMNKVRRPNDPGGHEVGMELFLFVESARGLPGLVWDGLKAAGKGLAWLFGRQAVQNAPAVTKAATSAMDAVMATDRNGLSWIARAIQKHSSRVGSAFKTTARTHAEFKSAGEKLAKEILENPAATRVPNRIGGYDVKLPDGRGIRFKADGTPHSLREPNNP